MFCDAVQVLETFLHLRINPTDIQSLKQNNAKKSAVELKMEKNKNRMEKKLKGKMSKKEKKVLTLLCQDDAFLLSGIQNSFNCRLVDIHVIVLLETVIIKNINCKQN